MSPTSPTSLKVPKCGLRRNRFVFGDGKSRPNTLVPDRVRPIDRSKIEEHSHDSSMDRFDAPTDPKVILYNENI